jgi:hypothetical protein
MTDKEISQDQVNQLVEDASYLQDEADAMQYVIDDVPYNESIPGKRSIAEILLLIDHAQTSYYRPILEEAVDNKRPTHLENFTHFEESFEFEGEVENIQKVLRKISKHRAGVVNAIKKISLIDWETVIYNNDQQLLLYNFARQMVRFERAKLNKIADQVMVYGKEKENRRELKKRRKQRDQGTPPDNHSDG